MNALTTRWLPLALSTAAALAGCNKDGDPWEIGGNNGDDGHGVDIPISTPDVTLTGDLSDGSQIDIGWADEIEIACWVTTENVNFNGSHVFFVENKDELDWIIIQAEPEEGLDISLYVLEFADADSVQTPPDVTSAARCEASFDATDDSNPGQDEAIELLGFSDRVMMIGVAGANNETEGVFDINIWRNESTLED